jgi:fructokinase
VSGPALARQHARLIGRASSAEAVAAGWQAGEAAATQVMQAAFAAFGRGLADVANVLDPDIIVLGGGLSKIPGLCDPVRAALAREVFSDPYETPVVRHQLGDSAGVLGAALVGRASGSAHT